MGSLIIRRPALSFNGAVVRFGTELVIDGEAKPFWFECPAEYANGISTETSDSFVISILAMAVIRGLDITVEGVMSSRLYYNLSNYYLELLRNLLPQAKKIRLEARNLTTTCWGGAGVFTGFSAGIDSFCTILDHSGPKVPPEYRVSHFVFNDLGGHGKNEVGAKIFHDRLARLQPIAADMGMPLIVVTSNLDSITNLDFVQDHTLRNTAVALLLQRACGKFLYSSAFHYRETHVVKTHGIACADSIGLPLLSTETTECISSGSQYTRFEKTEIVSSSSLTHSTLDVCLMPLDAFKTNCSKCYKCLRTQLSLEVLGKLDAYSKSFDLPTYRKYCWLYMCHVLGSKEPLIREIREGMNNRGFKPPLSAKIVAVLLPNKLVEIALVSCTWAQTKNPARILWHVLTNLPDALPRICKRLRALVGRDGVLNN